jgi:AhpC/TSA family
MELQARLDAIREASKTRMPPETRAVMLQHIDELRASGILDRVAAVGQPAPDFTLPNADGRPVSLAALRGPGPVVLSFYRGRW